MLCGLTHSTAAILGDNLVGVYLQGSCAVGDADLHSDCDFLIPVHHPLSTGEEHGFRKDVESTMRWWSLPRVAVSESLPKT